MSRPRGYPGAWRWRYLGGGAILAVALSRRQCYLGGTISVAVACCLGGGAVSVAALSRRRGATTPWRHARGVPRNGQRKRGAEITLTLTLTLTLTQIGKP
jgi:hypothetical protein